MGAGQRDATGDRDPKPVDASEALDQWNATREILGALSRHPPALGHVFEAIVRNAARLCCANFAFVMLARDDWLTLAARTDCTEEFARYLQEGFAVSHATTTGRAVLARAPVQVADFQNEPGVVATPAHRREDVRTVLAVPMLQADRVLGVIAVWRREARHFTERQVELLRGFADQAVIAVANVRLFETLQARNEELATALEALRRETDAHHRSRATISAMIEGETAQGAMLGRSMALQHALALAAQVAVTDSTVLITGETGTGKELMARAIHRTSRRADRPLITLNCAAISPELVESELFGHEKGAFTGAIQQRRGRFELADSGTLLLDEVGELRPDVQAKLLRVLQEGEFERLGGMRSLKCDVRLIAATNRDLHAQMSAGRFRADLFYRLNVFPIALPPLRERRDDIELLVRTFTARTARRLGRQVEGIAPRFLQKACAYDWPGNVRELENLVERALITHRGGTLDASELLPAGSTAAATSPPPEAALSPLAALEAEHIRRALVAAAGRVEGTKGAAALLGLNPSTLRHRMRRFGIRRG